MQAHSINLSKNFISGWYINEDLCNSIASLCRGMNRLKFDGERKSSFHGYLSAELKNLSQELHAQYLVELACVLDLYREEYPYLSKIKPLKVSQPEFLQVQLYDPGFAYSVLHCENNGSGICQDRCLAFMTYLNTVDQGGGTEFPDQGLTTAAERALTLVWPAYWTHPHRGVVAPREKKIIVTGWMVFDNSFSF